MVFATVSKCIASDYTITELSTSFDLFFIASRCSTVQRITLESCITFFFADEISGAGLNILIKWHTSCMCITLVSCVCAHRISTPTAEVSIFNKILNRTTGVLFNKEIYYSQLFLAVSIRIAGRWFPLPRSKLNLMSPCLWHAVMHPICPLRIIISCVFLPFEFLTLFGFLMVCY